MEEALVEILAHQNPFQQALNDASFREAKHKISSIQITGEKRRHINGESNSADKNNK